MVKTYIDTNIFVKHLFNKDTTISAELKRIESGSDQGITSILTILETIHAVRKIMTEEKKVPLSSVHVAVRTAIEFFYKMNNLKIIPDSVFDPATSIILSDSQTFLQKYPGKIKPDGSYKGFHAADVMHLSFALQYRCDEILTHDNDFDSVTEISIRKI